MRQKKTIHVIFKVSDPPWQRAGAASFTEQADRVERRRTQRFDPTTESEREQSQTRRRWSQETDSVLQQAVCPVSRGQFAPSNSHSLVSPSLAVL